jgi:uridine monophosphate synthetase
MFTKTKKSLAINLFDIGAIKFGHFKLKLHEKNPNAPLSPIYIDLRILRSFPDAMGSAIHVYRDLTRGVNFDLYADVPAAATPIVAILSYKTKVPMITPRMDKKEHGTKTAIDGVFQKGQVALLIDDLITKADSKIEAIGVLEENGLKVNEVLVLIDREQGGVQELEGRGFACLRAFGIKELLKFYLEIGKLDEEKYDRTIEYIELTSS